ncbi:hypothetical protein MMC31_001819 [Peltigera leucophlebia]|nr:hypothetical protein [Peltigera leucophlebia]
MFSISHGAAPLTTTKFRNIKPTPEKLLRQQTARIYTGSPRVKLFASASPAASQDLTLPLNEGSSSELIKNISTSHKIEFESFALVDNGKDRLPASQEEYNLMLKAFPAALSIGVFPPVVVVQFGDLPPKPWPLTVAGLPVLFTTKENTIGFEYGRPGGSFKKALDDYDAREHVTRELFAAAIAHFEQELSIPILSILNLAGPWIVTIPDGVEFSSLPYLLAKTLCHFKYASETEEHIGPAFRNTEPAGTVWDQTLYQILQPGIMLSSGRGLNELLTTSGIVVEDNNGYRYLTLASPGFPFSRESVYHSNANGALLGRVHSRLTGTNIALLRLSSSQGFRNETFGVGLPDGTNILPQKICGIKDPFSVRKYDEVSMNNPFSGYSTGVHVGVQQSKVPSDDPLVDHTWVTNQWTYIGNGHDEPMDGWCGSPVLDENGNVVSLIRFLTPSGFAVGDAASTLELGGLTLSSSL